VKIAILSDIHANLEALRATLDDISAQEVDRVVCLGDIVGYNANPAECVALLRALEPLCVAGNHDRAVTGQITTERFSATAAHAVAWTCEQLAPDDLHFLAGLPLEANLEDRLVAVHGALLATGGCERTYLVSDEQRRRSFEALARHPSNARICAYGHTHRLGVFELRAGLVRACAGDRIDLHEDAYYLINPGTVGQPRRTSDRRATYVVLDTARRSVAVRRVEYDASVPAAKTRRAGLAPRSLQIRTSIRAAMRWGARRLGVYDFVRRLKSFA
jgi:predicted phosphodiesterase